MRNLEIKAEYKNHNQLKKIMKEISARFVQKMHQVDTYFSVSNGRLKLREFDSKKSELIFYQRGEKGAKRWSDYHFIEISDTKELKNLLNKLFPIKVIVDKQRFLYMYKNARIHIDTVKGLGSFMEIEVLVKKGDIQAKELMQELLEFLKIPQKSFIKNSYSDLLIKGKSRKIK